MIEFNGTYFDGQSSRAYAVTIYSDGQQIRITGNADGMPLIFPLEKCRLTPPLGDTRRSVLLPNGGRCDTHDLRAISGLERFKGGNRVLRLVNFFESRWRLVAGCLVGLVTCIWLFTAHGIPFAAKKVAYSLPAETMESVSERTLQALDNGFFKPSQLSSIDAGRLQGIFDQLVSEKGSDFTYQLMLRHSPRAGANAFALPSGIIVVTDELVAMAENDRELIAILVHEIAHVENRHSLRMLFQNTGVFMLISVLVGDVASITSIAATLPTILVESGYSRQFEREADLVAGMYMVRRGWGTQPLQDILRRLTENQPGFAGPAAMSTHPDTRQRLRYLEDLEASLTQ